MMARWIRLASTAADFDAACAGLAAAQAERSAPILLWGETAASYRFALIAPQRLAPGRRMRWLAWGLAPAVAAYRQFGVPAYLNDNDLWLHGRRIAQSVVEAVGECVVIASSFLVQFPAKCVATPSAALEQAFRLRLEAQHGWQFEHSWPSGAERPALAAA